MIELNGAMAANHEKDFSKPWATDVKLLVGGQVINVHKFVLMAHSDVFQAKFERWEEKDGNEVEIKEVEYDHMLAFVKALYSGPIQLKIVEHAFSIMTIADKYNVTGMKSVCGEYIGSNLTTGNVLTSLIEADK